MAHFPDICHRIGNGVVFKTFGLTDNEDVLHTLFARGILSPRIGQICRDTGEECEQEQA